MPHFANRAIGSLPAETPAIVAHPNSNGVSATRFREG
jgi:hypothetical protein